MYASIHILESQHNPPVDCCLTIIREVATITYRSGPEWEQRFGRKRIDDPPEVSPNLCPEFEIESYLDYQVPSLVNNSSYQLLTNSIATVACYQYSLLIPFYSFHMVIIKLNAFGMVNTEIVL